MIGDSFARKFVARVGLADAAGLLDQNGRATEALRQRAERAVVARVFGIHPVVAGLIDGRIRLKGVFESLVAVAPLWASMQRAAAQGEIAPAFDITADVIEAVRFANVARQSHMTIAELLEQSGIEVMSPATTALLHLFQDYAALLADGLRNYAYDAVASGSRNMFGQSKPAEVLAAVQSI
jgi:hypothetical protein